VRGKGQAGPSATWWVVGLTAVISAMLVYTGVTTGEWRGVVISEIQVLVVAAATWVGVR
jgi:hypothetical protein